MGRNLPTYIVPEIVLGELRVLNHVYLFSPILFNSTPPPLHGYILSKPYSLDSIVSVDPRVFIYRGISINATG